MLSLCAQWTTQTLSQQAECKVIWFVTASFTYALSQCMSFNRQRLLGCPFFSFFWKVSKFLAGCFLPVHPDRLSNGSSVTVS